MTGTLSPRMHLDPHQKRPSRFIRHQQLGDWRLKVYSITAPGRAPHAGLIERTLALADTALPQPAFDTERYGIGFVIAHDAAALGISLVYWWECSNELHQRVFIGPRDDLDDFAPLTHQAAGCVWEIGVIDFERRAWIDDVLANPEGPDFDRYMTRRLDSDL